MAAGIEGDFAGHSLRRGFITNAAKKKIPIESIKKVTGQRSSAIVIDYVAAATFDDEPPLQEIVTKKYSCDLLSDVEHTVTQSTELSRSGIALSS